MKRIFSGVAAILLCLGASAQKVELVPFGDFENWTVRYIKESAILGGETRVNYVVAPKDTIRENAAYDYSKTIWASSNAYAVVMGVTKVSCSVTPDKGPSGLCAKLENNMASVKAAGLYDADCPASGYLEIIFGSAGASLQDVIRPGGEAPLPRRPVLQAFLRYARALSALHDRGLFHRDIKPSNILITLSYPEKSRHI